MEKTWPSNDGQLQLHIKRNCTGLSYA